MQHSGEINTLKRKTKRFDIFLPCVGCSEGLDAFRVFFKNIIMLLVCTMPRAIALIYSIDSINVIVFS